MRAAMANMTRGLRFGLIMALSPSIWERSQNLVEPIALDHWNDFLKEVPRASTNFALELFKDKEVTCAEVGVALGNNSASILSMFNVKQMYLIDPYIAYLIPYRWKSKVVPESFNQKRLQTAHKKLKKWDSICTWLEERSVDAVSKIPDDHLDFLYIDGEHSYQAYNQDLTLYYPKMKKGGILAGHDFTGNWLGVVRAVLDFAESYHLKLQTRQADWWMII